MFGVYFSGAYFPVGWGPSTGAPPPVIHGNAYLSVTASGTLTYDVVTGSASLSITAAGLLTFTAEYRPPPTPDRFQAAPLSGGVMGRLAIERPLVDYNQDIIISISGLASETVTLYAESASGVRIGNVPLHYLKTGKGVDGSSIQNGTYVIKADDLKWTWDNIAFLKSGSSDRVALTIESQFDYVEAPVSRRHV